MVLLKEEPKSSELVVQRVLEVDVATLSSLQQQTCLSSHFSCFFYPGLSFFLSPIPKILDHGIIKLSSAKVIETSSHS